MKRGDIDIGIKNKDRAIILGSSDLFAVTIQERDPWSKKTYSQLLTKNEWNTCTYNPSTGKLEAKPYIMKLAANCEVIFDIPSKGCFEGSVSAAATAGPLTAGVSGCFEACATSNFYEDSIYMLHLEVTPDKYCTSPCYPGLKNPSESLIA